MIVKHHERRSAHAKRGKSLNDLKSGTSIGRFSSDGAASTAVKGLRVSNLVLLLVVFK